MNKLVFKLLLIITFLVISVAVSFAGPEPPDPGIPIDGGAGFLLAAGVVYSIYRFKKNRKS